MVMCEALAPAISFFIKAAAIVLVLRVIFRRY